MAYETVIEAREALPHLADESWVFVDCRFFIREPDRAEREYRESHVAGAVFAHLDRDLSGPIVKGRTGRHPLPSPEAFQAAMSRLGVGPGSQVVAYDESTGALAAARLWWLLKWAGHDPVAVLDGGLDLWRAQGFPCAAGEEKRQPAEFVVRVRPGMAVDAEDVRAVLGRPDYIVLDARAEERFRGLNETLDPVAGHIPGAFPAPYMDNLRETGGFRPAPELARRFDELAGARDADHVIFYCGSGVTAAHDVLAFARAGKGMPKLYPGSWSHWITDPRRPVAAGGP